MRTQTVPTEILKLLKSRCTTSLVASLVRELRGAATFERRLVGASGKQKAGNVNILATASLGKANTCYQKGDPRLSLIFVNQSLHYFGICNDRNGIADAYKMKVMICREMKQYSVAESLFQTSLRLNAELNNEINTAETHFEMGELEVKRRISSVHAKRSDKRLSISQMLVQRRKLNEPQRNYQH